jgi:proteasome lid subunit RPN8/RPN11
VGLTLTQYQLELMQSHAESGYPHEACGLMIGRLEAATGEKQVRQVNCLENAWTPELAAEVSDLAVAGAATEAFTKSRRYWIDPQDFLRVQRAARQQNLSIIGVFHSHPEALAIPSECDRTLAWPEYSYIIISVKQGKAIDIKSWQLNQDHQFVPEPMKIMPASAATDRMPSRQR